jgi:hypothetical protein
MLQKEDLHSMARSGAHSTRDDDPLGHVQRRRFDREHSEVSRSVAPASVVMTIIPASNMMHYAA